MLETDEQTNERAFEAGDFEAYLPEKWTSNMYTLERRRVKNKLDALGDILEPEIESAGLTLLRHLSDEFPSLWNKKSVERQWLFFSRDEAARKELTNIIDREKTLADNLADPTPLFRHLFVGVSVSETHLEIGLRLHFNAWVDRKNLLNLMGDEQTKKRFYEGLSELPEHFEIGLDGQELMTVGMVDEKRLTALLRDFEAEHGWLFIGARLPKDQVLVIGEDIGDSAAAVFRALVPLYNSVAWSPNNDLISIDKVVAAHNEAIQQSHETLERERKAREDRLREKEVIGLAMREQIAERIEATQAWRSREIAAKRAAYLKAQNEEKEMDARAKAEAMAASWGLKKEASPAPEKPKQPKPRVQSDKPKRWDKPAKGQWHADKSDSREKKNASLGSYKAARRSVENAAPGELAIGAYVEVTKGFLKGRRGTIHEIDEKGGLKVAFGAVSSRLEKAEVRMLDSVAPPEDHRKKRSPKREKSGSRS